jgi:hypothetical protein
MFCLQGNFCRPRLNQFCEPGQGALGHIFDKLSPRDGFLPGVHRDLQFPQGEIRLNHFWKFWAL